LVSRIAAFLRLQVPTSETRFEQFKTIEPLALRPMFRAPLGGHAKRELVALPSIRTLPLPSGEQIPVLGQGTWEMGEDAASRDEELATLRLGLDLGLTLIDTAEIYGDGAAEELVAEAIGGRRDEVFLVTKVPPSRVTGHSVKEACDASLKRLRTDRIDLYLLHWRATAPLEDWVHACEALVAAGKIRHWGVSNFDPIDLAAIVSITWGEKVETDQVLYNLAHREIEFELLPWCKDWGLPVMAYSPIDRGSLVTNEIVVEIAKKHAVATAQVALAWVLRQDNVCAIPKASIREHVRENRGALDLELDRDDLKAIDEAFPPPTGPAPLPVY
jgi:diketogulonate reductase-like aldo/keto reductase